MQSEERVRTRIHPGDDIAIPNKGVRGIVKKLVNGGVTSTEWEAVRARPEQVILALSEHLAIDNVATVDDQGHVAVKDGARAFLKGLCQEQPISGFFHPLGIVSKGALTADVLRGILTRANPLENGCFVSKPITSADRDLLSNFFPSFYAYLRALPINDSSDLPTVPPALVRFMFHFIDRASASIKVDLPFPSPSNFDSDPYADLVIAPNNPLLRKVRTYEADKYQSLGSGGQPRLAKKGKKGTPSITLAADAEGSSRCQKVELRHSTFTPGVMHVSCPHQIVSIAHLMPRYEGPTMPFELLFTRFASAPKIIIYDNACNLHVSCTRREPSFFARTHFFSDRLHWRDHTTCSEGYHLDTPPPSVEALSGTYPIPFGKLNSQASEQINRKFLPLRTQMSFMTHEGFKDCLTIFLYYHNKKKGENLKASLKL